MTGELALPHARGFAILTCMDTRLDPAGIPVYGYLYDVETGRLVDVPDATAAGAAS